MMNKNINLTILLVLILTIVVIIYFLYHNYWVRRAIQFCGLELLGFIVSIVGNNRNQNGVVDLFLRLCKYYHPMGKIWFGCGLHIVVSDPESVELLLKKHVSKGEVYNHLKPSLGNAILVAPVDIWKKQRKTIAPTFNQNILNSCLDSFRKNSQSVVENLTICQNVQTDIYPEMFRYFYGIVGEFAMGNDLSISVEEHNEFMNKLQRGQTIVGKRCYNPLLQFDLLWKLSGYAKEEQSLLTRQKDNINRMLKEVEPNKSTNSKTFLNLLLTSHDGHMDDELVKELQAFFIAGTETSSNTSSFVMLMLAIHQDVQNKVYQELFKIFGNSNRDVTLKDLEKMNYLGQVINETLRLFPPGPVIFRKIEEDITIGQNIIRSGTNFLIPIIFIQRNPTNWPNPLKFDPNRFLPEEVAKRPRYSFMPFSIPPRNCIGMKFAEMSMKVVLSSVLRKFKVYTELYDSVESINLHIYLFLTPPKGYKVTLVSRLQ